MDGPSPGTRLTKHVVICNVNEKVRAIVQELRWVREEKALDVVLIVQDEALWADNPGWHPPPEGGGKLVTIVGCPADPEVLRAAHVAEARAAVILADPNQGQLADARSALVGIAIEREHPHIHTVMELNLAVNRSHLRPTLVDDVICLGEVAERLIAQSAISPGVSRLYAYLLTTQIDTSQLFAPTVPAALCGRTYRELARIAIRVRAPYTLCGFVRKAVAGPDGRAKREVVLNPRARCEPGRDTKLGERDQLIVVARRSPDLSRLTIDDE